MSSTYTSSPMIYTLSLHDALPICIVGCPYHFSCYLELGARAGNGKTTRRRTGRRWSSVDDLSSCSRNTRLDCSRSLPRDRKSTRLNSSHRCISYAVFCLKKKNILH